MNKFTEKIIRLLNNLALSLYGGRLSAFNTSFYCALLQVWECQRHLIQCNVHHFGMCVSSVSEQTIYTTIQYILYIAIPPCTYFLKLLSPLHCCTVCIVLCCDVYSV